VLGLSASSSTGLDAEIAALGTNLLTVQPGQTATGGTAQLTRIAPAMIARLPGVSQVQDVGQVTSASAYRSPVIPPIDTNGLTVDASTLHLPAAVGTSLAQGSYLNAATAREPVAVLGAAAAQSLGIDRIWPGERIWVGGMWFYLAGILAAEKYLHFGGRPSTIYVRAQASRVQAVDNLLAAQANPQDPEQAQPSVPSAALVARADAKGALNTLFLGLGAVALLVGAVGVANIMIISVLERRSEIGLRRVLGATKGNIRTQFLAEAILLALAGAAAGVLAGATATAVYAHAKGWAIAIPVQAWAGGLGAALLIGALAGLLPAVRAARLSPTQALWTL